MYEPSNLDSLEALQRKCVEMEIALSNCYRYMADSRRKEVVELAGAMWYQQFKLWEKEKTTDDIYQRVAEESVVLHRAIELALTTHLPVGGGACGASNIEDACSGLLGKAGK